MAKKRFTAAQVISNGLTAPWAYRPPAPDTQLPRSQALDPIPWSGIQMVPDLT